MNEQAGATPHKAPLVLAGLKVVAPATPHDAKGLLLASFADGNPVIFLEHKKLYRSVKGPVWWPWSRRGRAMDLPPPGSFCQGYGRARRLSKIRDAARHGGNTFGKQKAYCYLQSIHKDAPNLKR